VKISTHFRGIVFLAALGACQAASSQVVLVTEQEAEASRSAPPQFTPKVLPAPDAPRILLEAPDISHSLVSPIRISLRFRPTAPAVIRPETFRVFYGAFALDITRRITGSASVTPEGLYVSEATLPTGFHSLQIELEDSLGRRGQRRFEFVVE
jgi:hypothetical protein